MREEYIKSCVLCAFATAAQAASRGVTSRPAGGDLLSLVRDGERLGGRTDFFRLIRTAPYSSGVLQSREPVCAASGACLYVTKTNTLAAAIRTHTEFTRRCPE